MLTTLKTLIGFYVTRYGLAGDPPPGVVEAICDLCLRACPDLPALLSPERQAAGDAGYLRARRLVKEIVIAWGCCYKRYRILGVPKEWDSVWTRAYQTLKRMVRVWVFKTNAWLRSRAHVTGFAMTDAEAEHLVTTITWMLIEGTCYCRVGKKKPGPSRNCDCHRLVMWDPAQLSLLAFVARAVKGGLLKAVPRSSRHRQPRRGRAIRRPGGAYRVFAAGTLQQGMYFPFLREQVGLRGVDALAYVCPLCRRVNLMGAACPGCGHGPYRNGRLIPGIELATIPWLLIPSELDGGFFLSGFRRCKICGHLYPEHATHCNACDDGHRCRPNGGARIKHLWVQRQAPNFALNATWGDGSEERYLPAGLVQDDLRYRHLLIDLAAAEATLLRQERRVIRTARECRIHPVAAADLLRLPQGIARSAMDKLRARLGSI